MLMATQSYLPAGTIACHTKAADEESRHESKMCGDVVTGVTPEVDVCAFYQAEGDPNTQRRQTTLASDVSTTAA